MYIETRSFKLNCNMVNENGYNERKGTSLFASNPGDQLSSA